MPASTSTTVRSWFYRRTAPGVFAPIPLKTFERWSRGEAPLPRDDGFVWYVSLLLVAVDGKIIALDRVHYTKMPVNEEGYVDGPVRQEQVDVTLRAVWEKQDTDRDDPSVIEGRNRFAARRFQWNPTPSDLASLKEIVNRRARLDVMR